MVYNFFKKIGFEDIRVIPFEGNIDTLRKRTSEKHEVIHNSPDRLIIKRKRDIFNFTDFTLRTFHEIEMKGNEIKIYTYFKELGFFLYLFIISGILITTIAYNKFIFASLLLVFGFLHIKAHLIIGRQEIIKAIRN